MTAGRIARRLAIGVLFLFGVGCRRTAPASKPAGAAERTPLLTEQKLSPELRALVDRAHAHPAVATLEAAGCELALVMTGSDYDRFVDLRYGQKMPSQNSDAIAEVVYCQSRATPAPDCADVAPIFVRVARPKRAFQVMTGFVDPPFAPRCSGQHDATGKRVAGEGPGYPSSRDVPR